MAQRWVDRIKNAGQRNQRLLLCKILLAFARTRRLAATNEIEIRSKKTRRLAQEAQSLRLTANIGRADTRCRLELARLGSLQEVFYARALEGNVECAALVTKIIERRCIMLGLSMPCGIANRRRSAPTEADIDRIEQALNEPRGLEQSTFASPNRTLITSGLRSEKL